MTGRRRVTLFGLTAAALVVLPLAGVQWLRTPDGAAMRARLEPFRYEASPTRALYATKPFMACQDERDVLQVDTLRGDREALRRFATDKVQAGACAVLDMPEQFFVTGTDRWQQLYRVRPKGQVRELWATRASIDT